MPIQPRLSQASAPHLSNAASTTLVKTPATCGGSGIDMVGCHDGRILNCDFRHRGDNGANGVQTKGGSSNVAIQRCRFENIGTTPGHGD